MITFAMNPMPRNKREEHISLPIRKISKVELAYMINISKF